MRVYLVGTTEEFKKLRPMGVRSWTVAAEAKAFEIIHSAGLKMLVVDEGGDEKALREAEGNV